jgi:electron transport complex protein RnfE
MKAITAELRRGVITENPILVLMLGLCPSLAISTSIRNGFGMGIAVLFVLTCSNIIISLVRMAIPEKVRIPSYIVIIATFVSMVQLILKAYFPVLDNQLGIFVPLIVVNCIVLGRAEAFASKQNVYRSMIDGIVMGLGFTVSLCILSFIREILGSNALLGFKIFPNYYPMVVFIMAPGGFFTIALVMVIIRYYFKKKSKN